MANDKSVISGVKKEMSAMQELENMVNRKMHERYGNSVPEPVLKRVKNELEVIQQKDCVRKFLVMSRLADDTAGVTSHAILRGTDSNYEVLFLMGITDLDPMPRHIWCTECGHWEASEKALFEMDVCPKCGKSVFVEGLNLPCADIALPNYETELSVSSQTKRCYTDKLKKLDQNVLDENSLGNFDLHEDYEKTGRIAVRIYSHSGLDIISACEQETGILAKNIPLSSPEVYKLISELIKDSFSEQDSLVTIACKKFGMYILDELIPSGIKNVWQDHLVCMPASNFDELVRLFGLIHGTGTFFDNGEELVKTGAASPTQILCCREDVLDYLAARGMDIKMATEIMECVRKGKIYKNRHNPVTGGFTSTQWEAMIKCGAEDWFIENCRRMKYMFPRGHCALFVTNMVRLLWYAIHTPEAVEKAFANINK